MVLEVGWLRYNGLTELTSYDEEGREGCGAFGGHRSGGPGEVSRMMESEVQEECKVKVEGQSSSKIKSMADQGLQRQVSQDPS